MKRMKPYFILVRQPERLAGHGPHQIDRTRCARLLQRAGARLFDVYPVLGHFDEMLVCFADNEYPIQKLVDELRPYEATAILASNCASHGPTVQPRGESKGLSASSTTRSCHIVHSDDRMTLSEMLAKMARNIL